jgi:hypothetical protein
MGALFAVYHAERQTKAYTKQRGMTMTVDSSQLTLPPVVVRKIRIAARGIQASK